MELAASELGAHYGHWGNQLKEENQWGKHHKPPPRGRHWADFLRLPLTTLLRCVGVCQHWHDFIRDPPFATSHLQNAQRYTLLFFPQGVVSASDWAWRSAFFGSCNGLLALYTKTSTIKIANFTTGECMNLQKPAKNMRGDHFSFYSFAFHPVTKEYKITHLLGDCVEGCARKLSYSRKKDRNSSSWVGLLLEAMCGWRSCLIDCLETELKSVYFTARFVPIVTACISLFLKLHAHIQKCRSTCVQNVSIILLESKILSYVELIAGVTQNCCISIFVSLFELLRQLLGVKRQQ
jgi:hypothetical protein